MPFFTYESKSIHYRERGEGELVVVLPDQASGAAAHSGPLERLGRHYRAVALDYLGTGRSDRLERWPEDWWAACARQVVALMEHLDTDRARLVGTGGGAVVALHTAAAVPRRVNAVVADSFSSEFDQAMLERAVMDPRWDPAPEQRALWYRCHGADWRAVVRADSRLLKTLVRNGGRWLDIDLGAITAPVLLTGSRCDPMLPDIEADYRALVYEIPDVTVLLGRGAGHPNLEARPDRFHAEALAFLDQAVYATVA